MILKGLLFTKPARWATITASSVDDPSQTYFTKTGGILYTKGKYKLLLQPSTYNITAGKTGYVPQTKQVVVKSGSKVTLDFDLERRS